MKSYDKKLTFIALRADNLSLAKIADQLGVSRHTCSKWNREYHQEISEEQDKRHEECKELYFIQCKARIKRLSDTLKRIDSELCNKDFSQISPENLLRLKLKYESELAKENATISDISIADGSPDKITQAISEIHRMIVDGTISEEQAKLRLETIRTMIHANEHCASEW